MTTFMNGKRKLTIESKGMLLDSKITDADGKDGFGQCFAIDIRMDIDKVNTAILHCHPVNLKAIVDAEIVLCDHNRERMTVERIDSIIEGLKKVREEVNATGPT